MGPPPPSATATTRRRHVARHQIIDTSQKESPDTAVETDQSDRIMELVEWPSGESPEEYGTAYYDGDTNSEETDIQSCCESDINGNGDTVEPQTTDPERSPPDLIPQQAPPQLKAFVEPSQVPTSREQHQIDHAKSLHRQRTLGKFLFFDEQDNAWLHRPTPIRNNYGHDPSHLSGPLVQSILEGPQGPSSLLTLPVRNDEYGADTDDEIVRNRNPLRQDDVMPESDSIPYQNKIHEENTSRRRYRMNGISPTSSIYSTPSTATSTASSRVQLFWNQQIAGRSEPEVPLSECSDLQATKATPSPSSPRRSPTRSQPRVSAKIRALQRQFAGET